MRYRLFGNTGRRVSEVGIGTWQLGTRWGTAFNEEEALKVLQASEECGINFIDTADVYNGGRSEEAIGSFIRGKRDCFFITTKCGRKLKPHTAEMYTPHAVSDFIDGSLSRLGTDRIDLLLLHCPPSAVFSRDDIFEELERQKKAGKILYYGVSIEKIEDGLKAMEYGIDGIEVIFNMFRLKPLDILLPKAEKEGVGIIARVPLASGLLTGKFSADTQFEPKDHRTFNRNGESFDKGETFSGVPYELGLEAVEELKRLFNTDNLAPVAIRWILMHPQVSTVIPGASRESQIRQNVIAQDLPELSAEQMDGVRRIYDKYLRADIHPQW